MNHQPGTAKTATSSPNESLANAWQEVIELTVAHTYPATVELFRQGSQAEDAYLIEAGLIKLIRLEHHGQEVITNLCFPGWLLGAASLIVREPYPVTAVTLTKCSIRRLSGQKFYRLVETSFRFSWRLHQMHCHELSDQIAQVGRLGCLSARHRLEQLFWRLICAMEPTSEGELRAIRFHAPLRNWELAELIAVTPQHLCKMLKEMEQEGIIRREKGWLIFLDPRKLRLSI